MTAMQRETECDLCGSQEKVLIKTEDGYPISRCRRCSLIFVSRIPHVEQGKVIGEYYSGTDREIESSRLRYERVSRFLTEQIGRLKPAKGKLLDVGCGYGFFLLQAQKVGWQVYGTELSEIAVRYARDRQNLPNVVFSDLSDDEFSHLEFDAINLTNVLEHVPSPAEVLANCHRRLANNGILLIRVPNMDFHHVKERCNAVLRLFGLGKGREASYLASPSPIHLYGFTARTLRRYFERVGFETLEIVPSRLSSKAAQNIVYRTFEAFVGVLYVVSFRTINVAPTLLAIAVKRK